MKKLLVAIVVAALAAAAVLVFQWTAKGPLLADTDFIVPRGATLAATAERLEEQGAIRSSDAFRLMARALGSVAPIKAGEFRIPAGSSPAAILRILQYGEPLQRLIVIPEGLPSILVHEKLMAEELLTGEAEVPAEGSVLPGGYSFERGEPRAAVLKRMQDAMTKTLAELWAARRPSAVVKTPEEAVNLAAIVEKETAKAEERRTIAGVYSNRLRIGMMLQADPTVIYPITKGKPLGRRIRQSELRADNGYNTYAKAGLPAGPIANPGRASIEAVLDPETTDALYFVADGTGGHVFARTLGEHNANVVKWRAIRRERGEL
ncbi:endolytic transglycosylase MltG [Sphingosinicella microcystinivorans]|uniref:endolytic transglycosylase MltG n=1 Tax=Sphingosinicella microcystinivorans TaxID=335406 RepID=UPI0022F3A83D|nr:endolytic transglycosylase MltG [Sphingosinicella microcystinivorans]WBX85996.1 endolytic transglycosylase MltG [Sphingosinicella microcystinivorans]